MEFGPDNGAEPAFKRGKLTAKAGNQLDPDTFIKDLDQEDFYKYLGVHEGKGIQLRPMRETIKKKYYRRVRMVLKTELNYQNRITDINSLAVQFVQYSLNDIKWNLSEIQQWT